jgi:hypothetical protein
MLFEGFEQGELFPHSYQRSEETSKVAAAKAYKLIGELTILASKINEMPKTDQAAMKEYMKKYLGSRTVDELDSDTFIEVLRKIGFASSVREKKAVDQDGDGDTDFVDAKVAQYKAGGIRKDIAIAKAKLFAKKNNIKDSKTPQNPKAKSSRRG